MFLGKADLLKGPSELLLLELFSLEKTYGLGNGVNGVNFVTVCSDLSERKNRSSTLSIPIFLW